MAICAYFKKIFLLCSLSNSLLHQSFYKSSELCVSVGILLLVENMHILHQILAFYSSRKTLVCICSPCSLCYFTCWFSTFAQLAPELWDSGPPQYCPPPSPKRDKTLVLSSAIKHLLHISQ